MRLVTCAVAAALATILSASSSLAQTAAQPAADPAIYVHAGALLDKPGQAPRGPSTIVIRNGKVDAVRDGLVQPERGARLVDLRNQFVLPGLIDMHVHILSDDDKVRARLEANTRDPEDNVLLGVDNARRTLEAGFTTIRDLGSDVHSVTALRDAILAGLVQGPTIVAAGNGISISGGHGDGANSLNRKQEELVHEHNLSVCNGAEDCRRAVRQQISQGADVIKFTATGGVLSNVSGGLGQQMFPDEMKAIVDTAHMFGRRVAAHAHGKDGIKGALEAGVDSIEHGSFTDAQTNELFKSQDAWLVPTLLAPVAALAQARAGARPAPVLAKAEATAIAHGRNFAAAARAGVKVAFGTDTGVSSHGDNAQEFALLVKAGLTPAAAIRAATLDAATLLGRTETLGSIEPGKDADLVAVARSPLEDVTELERVRFVMRRGVVHKLDGARQAFPPL